MSLQRLAALAQSLQQAGNRFFDTLAEQLAEVLAVSRTEIWEIAGPGRSSLRELAIWDRDRRSYPAVAPVGPYLAMLGDSQVVLDEGGYLGTPLMGSNGQVVGFLALQDERPLDMSRQPQLVAQLFAPLAAAEIERRRAAAGPAEQANAAEELLAVAIHELRDPLSGLVNAADVLQQTTDLDQQARWAADVVGRQSHSLVALMDNLSTASDLDRGKLELRFETLQLEQVVRDAIAAVRPALALRQQELQLETALGPVPVWGDHDRMLQAMTRLLEHVARETDVGGRLVLSVRVAGAKVAVRLLGPPGAADQARELPDRRLGLILVRRLIALHGGALAVHMPEAGAAMEVEVHLPLVGKAAPITARPGAAPARAFSSRRILVVDDEYDSATALGMALEKRGHQVRIVHNGRAALEVLPGFRPDAVLLDIGLPGLDGLDVARAIRAMPDQTHLTLIAATGMGWSEDRQRSLQAGFDHHLVKPLALEDVEAALLRARSGRAPAGAGSL